MLTDKEVEMEDVLDLNEDDELESILGVISGLDSAHDSRIGESW